MKKSTEAISITLDKATSLQLTTISKQLGITKSALVSELLAKPISELSAYCDKLPEPRSHVLERGKTKAREKLREVEAVLKQKQFNFDDLT